MSLEWKATAGSQKARPRGPIAAANRAIARGLNAACRDFGLPVQPPSEAAMLWGSLAPWLGGGVEIRPLSTINAPV